MLDLKGFVDKAPSSQNILDLFDGEWSSTMPPEAAAVSRPGPSGLFSDPRILWAADVLGPFKDLSILELGPLEAAHSFMMERMGARSVTAVEANARAFLKCLCVKEILGLNKVQFLLGNFVPFLARCSSFDVIVASGVLYHMPDPIDLIDRIAAKSDRVFLWTHYFDAARIAVREDHDHFDVPGNVGDTKYIGSKKLYPGIALSWNGFSGGLESYATWLERDSLLRAFADRGYKTSVAFEDPGHVNGPSLAICAQR